MKERSLPLPGGCWKLLCRDLRERHGVAGVPARAGRLRPVLCV